MVGRHIKHIAAGAVAIATVLIGAGLIYSHAAGAQFLSVQSGSMVPMLHKGDLVTVTRVPVSQLAVGDVITYMSPKYVRQTITHRVIALPSTANGNRIITKGDANATADTPISAGAVLGKVQQHMSFVGYAVDVVRKPVGLLLCIYIPALVVVVDELRRLAAYYRAQQPYFAPGRRLRNRKRQSTTMTFGVKAFAICIVAGLAVAVPAQAALTSNALLTGNSIATTRTSPLTHIVFKSVAFECSLDNTTLVNKLTGLLLYNPGNADAGTGNWYIQSSQGRLLTFRPQTMFDAYDDYDLELDLKTGVNYSGDFMALFDNTGTVVDAISWGTDTTYLHPSLPGTHAGTTFRRVSLITDTNTTIDWAVSVDSCPELLPE